MTGAFVPSGLDELDRALRARVTNGELPGAVAVVADRDDEWVDPIGTVAFDSAVPMRRDTVFRIASITKPMLAAVTMMPTVLRPALRCVACRTLTSVLARLRSI